MNFKKIKSIKTIKTTPQSMFNFSVPGPENYIANKIVLHNCYVKAHSPTPHQTSLCQQIRLLQMLDNPEIADIGQITVSIDTLPMTTGTVDDDHIAHMINLMHHLVKMGHVSRGVNLPELHITVFSPSKLLEYTHVMGRDPKTLSGFDLISFSHLDSDTNSLNVLSDLRRQWPNTYLGWNRKMPTRSMTDSELLGWISKIETIGKNVDQIYMLLRKSPIGAPRDLLDVKKDRQNMAYDLYYMKRLQEVANERGWGHKLIVDGCLQDVLKFNKTGFGCSSNISRFQVWPDGSVSGCAYKHRSVTDPADTAEEILENIRTAQNYYDFQECHLPEVLDSVRVL